MKLKDLVDVSHHDVSHYGVSYDVSHDVSKPQSQLQNVSLFKDSNNLVVFGAENWMESNFTSSMKNTDLVRQSGSHSFLSLPYTQVYGASTKNPVDLVSEKDNSSAPLFSLPLPLPSSANITTNTIPKLELTQSQMEKGTRRFSAQETKYLFSLFNSGIHHPDSETLAGIAIKLGKSARSLQTWFGQRRSQLAKQQALHIPDHKEKYRQPGLLKVVVQHASSRPPLYANVQSLSHWRPKQQQPQQQQQHPSIKQGQGPYIFQEFSPDPSPTSATSSFFKDQQTQKRQQDYLSTLSSSLPPTYPTTTMDTHMEKNMNMFKPPLSDPQHSTLTSKIHHYNYLHHQHLKIEKRSPPALPIFIPDAAFLHRHRRSSHVPLPQSPPTPPRLFLRRRSSCPAIGSNKVFLPSPFSLPHLPSLKAPLKSIGTVIECRPDVASEAFIPPSQIWSSPFPLSFTDTVKDHPAPLSAITKRIVNDHDEHDKHDVQQQGKKRRRLRSRKEFVNR